MVDDPHDSILDIDYAAIEARVVIYTAELRMFGQTLLEPFDYDWLRPDPITMEMTPLAVQVSKMWFNEIPGVEDKREHKLQQRYFDTKAQWRRAMKG